MLNFVTQISKIDFFAYVIVYLKAELFPSIAKDDGQILE